MTSPQIRKTPRILHRLRGVVAALLTTLLMIAAPIGVGAQQDDDAETFVLNLRDTEIEVLAEQISEITGRTLILDPEIEGEVTVISSEPLDREGIWALFQSILRLRGYIALQSGAIWEVVPEATARTRDTGAPSNAIGSQDFVTRLLRLDRLPAAEAVRVLGPLVDAAGYIEAVSDPNAIVITDTSSNVARIFEIARSFDTDTGIRAEVIRFNFTQAEQAGAAIAEVLGEAATRANLSIDPGSNALLVRGTPEEIEMIRSLATAMDVAPRPNPREALSTSIYRLDYADAETVVETVQATIRGGTGLATAPAGPSDAGVDQLGQESVEDVAVEAEVAAPLDLGDTAGDVAVAASTESNAVVIRGTARQIEEITQLIAALDVQRPQVMIEAAIVEISGDVADRLGAQLGLAQNLPEGGFAATSFSNSGTSLQTVLAALGAPGGRALSTGFTAGAGSGDFGLLVQALSQSSRANLLSTPSVTTMDNRPATIVVGQNVPFRTGSFATDGNTIAPFTTIERRDVGITMQVLPRVTAGGIVRLEISQEVSSLVNANVQGAADLITNRRVINTTVEAMNGGTIVLGGLITDDDQFTEAKVPGLGDIPVVGNLFRSRGRDMTRRTLFVFMRPRVLTSQHDIQTVAQGRLGRAQQAEVGADRPANLPRQRPVVRKLPLELNGLY